MDKWKQIIGGAASRFPCYAHRPSPSRRLHSSALRVKALRPPTACRIGGSNTAVPPICRQRFKILIIMYWLSTPNSCMAMTWGPPSAPEWIHAHTVRFPRHSEILPCTKKPRKGKLLPGRLEPEAEFLVVPHWIQNFLGDVSRNLVNFSIRIKSIKLLAGG